MIRRGAGEEKLGTVVARRVNREEGHTRAGGGDVFAASTEVLADSRSLAFLPLVPSALVIADARSLVLFALVPSALASQMLDPLYFLHSLNWLFERW